MNKKYYPEDEELCNYAPLILSEDEREEVRCKEPKEPKKSFMEIWGLAIGLIFGLLMGLAVLIVTKQLECVC